MLINVACLTREIPKAQLVKETLHRIMRYVFMTLPKPEHVLFIRGTKFTAPGSAIDRSRARAYHVLCLSVTQCLSLCLSLSH